MTEWREVVLGDLCHRVTVGHVGKMADEYVEDGVPFLRSQNVSPFAINGKGMLYISEQFHQRLVKSTLRTGDVVVIRTGYPGTAAVVPPHLDNSNCADLVVITPSDQLNPSMLAAVFNSAWGRSAVGGQLVGAAQQHFNIGSARALRIRLPGRDEQDRIAAILCALTNIIENNQQRIELLEEMAQAIYRDWFVEFRYPGHRDVLLVDSDQRPIPEGWRWVEMRELAYEVRRGVDPDSLDPETPYFGLEHMPERSIAISAWGKAADAGSRKYRFETGEIIFGKIRPYFHKVGIPPVPGICSTDAIVIHPRERRSAGLVLAVVSSDPFVQHAVQTSQGTKMPRANWAVLERYPVAVPADALLARFDQHMSDTVSLVHALVMANRNLRITRDLLLPRLVSGEIDVSKLDLDGVVDSV